MIVFTPAPADANTFFDEITHFSKNEFVHGERQDYKESYGVVLLQWPEQLVGWNEPDKIVIKQWSDSFEEWKENSKIISIVHNNEPHSGMTPLFQELYDLVASASDAMLHFGNNSKREYEQKFPDIKHYIISHPLYEKTFLKINKSEARKLLGIENDKKVVVAPGNIRNEKERLLILRAFQGLNNSKKTLLVPNMFWLESNIEFSGRQLLKRLFDVKKWLEKKRNGNLVPPEYILNYGFMKAETLALYIAAADVVFLPRIETLNSGNLYLGLTFGKIVVGPKVGNITGELESLGFPSFELNDVNSPSIALKQGLDLSLNEQEIYDNLDLKKYAPRSVAKELDIIFEEMTSVV